MSDDEHKKLTPFDFIKSINDKNYIVLDKTMEKQYTAFVVNRGLSQFLDCVPYVEKMNVYHKLPQKMQYDYLFHAIRKNKRFSAWAKQTKYEHLDVIIEYYQVNKSKALSILDRLSDEQVEVIVRLKESTGGAGKRKQIKSK